MKKLFIRDLETRFSFSALPITTQAVGEGGKPITTLAIGEEGKRPVVRPRPAPPRPIPINYGPKR